MKSKSFSLSTLTHKPSMPNVAALPIPPNQSTDRQSPLEAAADGPAGVVLGIGETAGRVDQHPVKGDTGTQAQRAEPIRQVIPERARHEGAR